MEYKELHLKISGDYAGREEIDKFIPEGYLSLDKVGMTFADEVVYPLNEIFPVIAKMGWEYKSTYCTANNKVLCFVKNDS